MPKSDTIEAIRKLNPTANPEFLSEFHMKDLEEYLRRLGQAAPRPSVMGADDLLNAFEPVAMHDVRSWASR